MEHELTDLPNVTEPEPAPRKHRWWIPVVISVSALLVIGGMVGVVFAAFSLVRSSGHGSNQALISGEPGEPRAAAPLECPPSCFDDSSIEAAVMSDSDLDAFGITQHDYPWGTYDPTTAGEIYRSGAADWKANDGTPNQCIFALSNSPASIALDGAEATNQDEIQFTGSHADEGVKTTLDQSMRIFPTSADAEAYLLKLKEQIADCDLIEIGPVSDRYSAEITPVPALSLPDSIAATGWVRTGDPGPRWRAYVTDLQRGNLVVRLRLLTDGSMTEADYLALVEQYAGQLGGLAPIEPAN